MSHDWHLIAQTIAHTGLSLLITYITWLIIRAQLVRVDVEREEHHD